MGNYAHKLPDRAGAARHRTDCYDPLPVFRYFSGNAPHTGDDEAVAEKQKRQSKDATARGPDGDDDSRPPPTRGDDPVTRIGFLKNIDEIFHELLLFCSLLF